MKVKFARYSMCICGFPMLKDSVPVGTEYEVNEQVKNVFTWRCGGCHKINSVQGIWVYPRPDQPDSFAGFLPAGIFEFPDQTPTANQEEP